MNSIEQTGILKEADGSTTEKWNALKEAVQLTRDDLVVSDMDSQGRKGKWALRYPNGRRVASEPEVVFQQNARRMVLSLMGKVEGLYAIVQDKAIFAATVSDLKTQVENLTAQKEAAISNLKAQIPTGTDSTAVSEPPVETTADDPAPVSASHVPAEPGEVKTPRKRKTKTE
jgi:hypothetical protein